MKMKLPLSVSLCLGGLTLALLLTGCETPFAKKVDKALFQETAWQTNQIAATNYVQVTNTVTIVTRTNEAGVVSASTNVVPVNITVNVPAREEVKPTAWAPNAATVNTVSALAPLAGPYGALAGAALPTLLAAVAAWRGKRYKDAAISIAQGVQQTIESLPTSAPEIIKAQKAVQEADGTREIVRDLINNFVVSK